MSDSAQLAIGLLMFAAAGIAMVAVALAIGRLIRPRYEHPVKSQPYECGEVAVGSAFVQFDVRMYVAALVFLVFDAEVALLFPWAVVYRAAGLAGFVDLLIFVGIVAVGFVYLWRCGSLDWVRSRAGQSSRAPQPASAAVASPTRSSERVPEIS